jgi:hypothetical protein
VFSSRNFQWAGDVTTRSQQSQCLICHKEPEILNKHFMQLLAPKRLLRALNRNDDDDDDILLLFVIFFTSSSRILGHILKRIMALLLCHFQTNNFCSSYGVVTQPRPIRTNIRIFIVNEKREGYENVRRYYYYYYYYYCIYAYFCLFRLFHLCPACPLLFVSGIARCVLINKHDINKQKMCIIIIIIIIIAWRRGWLVRSRRKLCDEYLYLNKKNSG